MYNEFEFPISVEEFAAYLDGNLPENEMCRVSSMIHNNLSMQELAEASQLIADTMDDYSTIGLDLPKEILSMDFSIPEIDGWVVSEPICDEFEVATCAFLPDYVDEGDMPNYDAAAIGNKNEILDMETLDININCEDLPLDGE